jgi:hypothetical protein
MNYKEVQIELKHEFESFLKPLGYKVKKDIQGFEFRLNLKNYAVDIGFGVVNYVDDFYTGCYIGIDIFQIQRIEKEIFEGSYYNTLGATIARYFNEVNYRYRIKNIEDIKEWGKIVRTFYNEFAVPFFEKYSTVDSIDKLLNEHPTEKLDYKTLDWRIIQGLIAAKLNNNPKYNELRDYYKSEVESQFQGYFMYEKCMKVINFLDKYTSEELNRLAEVK